MSGTTGQRRAERSSGVAAPVARSAAAASPWRPSGGDRGLGITVMRVPRRHRHLALSLLCPLALVCVAVVVFLSASRDENFWWADGASFALNGEFLRDYIAAGMPAHPLQYAQAWFRHYPALTISLYPPIFPLAEAAAFATFGFSGATAQATVAAFAALAAYGIYRVVRTAADPLPAVGAGILLLAAPEVLRWSREIVMDVPAMAFLLLAAAALARFQATQRPRALLLAVSLTLAAIYTKQTAAFVVPAFVVALALEPGWVLARRRSTWIAVAVGVIGMLPLAIFTLLYARENFHIAFGAGTGQRGYDRLSLQALLAYGRVLPDIVGIVPLCGGVGWLGLVAARGFGGAANRRLTVLMLAWFIIDYLGVSLTADFETRYATLLCVPPVVFSVLLVTRLLPRMGAAAVTLAVSLGLFVLQVETQPITRVEGYGDVAEYVLDHTEPGDAVLFHGMASKNFTFSVRARSPQPKIDILRAEKYLVDYHIMRDWGITDHGLSSRAIESIVDRNNVAYVVFQPNFWTDQPSVARLQQLIDSERFHLVAQFGITSDDASRCAVIRVYRNVLRGFPGEEQDGPRRPAATSREPGPM